MTPPPLLVATSSTSLDQKGSWLFLRTTRALLCWCPWLMTCPPMVQEGRWLTLLLYLVSAPSTTTTRLGKRRPGPLEASTRLCLSTTRRTRI